MTFNKTVIQKIVYLWGLGLTAEETQKILIENNKIKISLHTIYNKRNSITAQQMIDELLRVQQRDIAAADSKALRMKYRNELLKILLPQRIEQKTNVNMHITGLDQDINKIIQFSKELNKDES